MFFNRFSLFFKCFPSDEQENLASSIGLCCCVGNISSPVRYQCLSILLDENADIFAVALLMLYCNFSSMISSSIVNITLYTDPNSFFRKCNGLPDGRVLSMVKMNMVLQCIFCKAF